MDILLYSNDCPRCKILKKKLDTKGIKYKLIDDLDIILDFAEKNNISTSPILVVDNVIYEFGQANQLINTW